MHVTVSKTFPAAIRGEIEAVVRDGFAGVECDDVEVHVKARSRWCRRYGLDSGDGLAWPWFRTRGGALRVAGIVGGEVFAHRYPNPRAGRWSGRTYQRVPSIARVEPGVRFLVTVLAPPDPRRAGEYPTDAWDPRLKTGPVVELRSWRDALFFVVAHEAHHVHQFRHGLPTSELTADLWAAARLVDRTSVS